MSVVEESEGLDFGFWASGYDLNLCLSIGVLIYRSVICRFLYLPIFSKHVFSIYMV